MSKHVVDDHGAIVFTVGNQRMAIGEPEAREILAELTKLFPEKPKAAPVKVTAAEPVADKPKAAKHK